MLGKIHLEDYYFSSLKHSSACFVLLTIWVTRIWWYQQETIGKNTYAIPFFFRAYSGSYLKSCGRFRTAWFYGVHFWKLIYIKWVYCFREKLYRITSLILHRNLRFYRYSFCAKRPQCEARTVKILVNIQCSVKQSCHFWSIKIKTKIANKHKALWLT